MIRDRVNSFSNQNFESCRDLPCLFDPPSVIRINALGGLRVVINETYLDDLAVFSKAGDPNKGGGFIITKDMDYIEEARPQEKSSPDPEEHHFSLASGGTIFMRDPHPAVEKDQLNDGVFTGLTKTDRRRMEPYIIENQNLFGIKVYDLLTGNRVRKLIPEVYCNVLARTSDTVLVETENR